MDVLFLDFDGVIIDSVDECFKLSYEVYYGTKGNAYSYSIIRDYFYQYRGLVRPAYQYLALMNAIEKKMQDKLYNIGTEFISEVDSLGRDDSSVFEYQFFALRAYYQKDKEKWIKVNPLTEYGETLIGSTLGSTYVITTKNIESVELILNHYGIKVAGIFDKEDYNKLGDKGEIIKCYLDNNKQYTKAIFVDDAIEHLDSAVDPRIESYFADWGYGINTFYNNFSEDMWQLGR